MISLINSECLDGYSTNLFKVFFIKFIFLQNERLHEEIQSLKDDKESLAQENARLTEEVWRLSVASGPSEPAVFCPLPQGVYPLPALPHLPLLRLLALILSAWTTGIGLIQKPSHLLLKNLNNLQTHFLLKLIMMHK